MPKLKRTASKKAKREKVKKVMDEWASGDLHSGSENGPVVTNRRQAIAIALSESGQSKRRKKHKKRK